MARTSWDDLKAARAGDSAVEAAYAAAKLAFQLGEQVRGMREERGWSQRELAKLTGMTQPAIARFEAGGTTPTLPILERIANAFDTTLSVELTPKAVAYPVWTSFRRQIDSTRPSSPSLGGGIQRGRCSRLVKMTTRCSRCRLSLTRPSSRT